MDYQPFNKIVANIPYAISEPLFKKLLKTKFDLAVLLTGENFYQLLQEESKWSIAAKLYFEVEKIIDVPRDSFEPRPRVDSVLIKITPRTTELNNKEKVLKELFNQNDKKLKNALMFALMRVFKLTKNQAKEKMEEIKIYTELQNKRIDHLSNVQFKFLLEKLKKL
jgi:16S rRNA (adenine1518-N6/adenine1519-N6)-dimethyltransferase